MEGLPCGAPYIHQGWNDCVLESDCALLIVALQGSAADFSELGVLWRIVVHTSHSFNSCETCLS